MSQKDCSCIKGKFDFYISEIACDKILYQDLSVWMSGENYAIPETYDIEVYSLEDGVKSLVNKISVSSLGITDISKLLPIYDAVYEIKTISCQNTYIKWAAVLPKLQCCLDKYMASDEYDMYKHREAERLLNGSRTSALFNQPKQAVEYYKMGKSLIDKLNCDC